MMSALEVCPCRLPRKSKVQPEGAWKRRWSGDVSCENQKRGLYSRSRDNEHVLVQFLSQWARRIPPLSRERNGRAIL